uniref:Uncharacterized protein n=1 Tax=Glycine max TaxID=3847 RepID=A0A0R0EJI5_SOYBN
MKERLKAIWKLEDGFDLMDITNGYYLVNLDMGKDQDKAINGRVDKTLVWVWFMSLGVVFYEESVLLTLASAIGGPIKVDLHMLNMARGCFAQVCVEIDLNVPVVGHFYLNGEWYNVEYKGLHMLCASCD